MEKCPNIYQRLNAVMRDASSVPESDKKVNNQYSYISHSEVSRVLQKPLVDHGVVVVPTVESLTQEGNSTIAQVRVDFVNMDEPGDRVSVTYYGYGIDNQDKGPGKAITYAVKYALLKVFCLSSGAADDVEAHDIPKKVESHDTPRKGSMKSNGHIPCTMSNAFAIKEEIKKHGGRWNAPEKTWMIPPHAEPALMVCSLEEMWSHCDAAYVERVRSYLMNELNGELEAITPELYLKIAEKAQAAIEKTKILASLSPRQEDDDIYEDYEPEEVQA